MTLTASQPRLYHIHRIGATLLTVLSLFFITACGAADKLGTAFEEGVQRLENKLDEQKAARAIQGGIIVNNELVTLSVEDETVFYQAQEIYDAKEVVRLAGLTPEEREIDQLAKSAANKAEQDRFNALSEPEKNIERTARALGDVKRAKALVQAENLRLAGLTPQQRDAEKKQVEDSRALVQRADATRRMKEDEDRERLEALTQQERDAEAAEARRLADEREQELSVEIAAETKRLADLAEEKRVADAELVEDELAAQKIKDDAAAQKLIDDAAAEQVEIEREAQAIRDAAAEQAILDEEAAAAARELLEEEAAAAQKLLDDAAAKQIKDAADAAAQKVIDDAAKLKAAQIAEAARIAALVDYHDWNRWQENSWCPHATDNVNLFMKAWNPSGSVVNDCSGFDINKHKSGEVIIGVEVLGEGTGGEGQLRGGFSYYNVILRDNWNYSNIAGAWGWSGAYRGFYAGLHIDSYVGAPLGPNNGVDGGDKATWKGYFSEARRHTGYNPEAGWDSSAPFELEVDFSKRTIKNISALPNATDRGGWYFTASYTPEGFVTGRINNSGTTGWYISTASSYGHISGIIGQKGVIAAFVHQSNHGIHEDDSRYFSYSGGFVACPTVNNDGTGTCR